MIIKLFSAVPTTYVLASEVLQMSTHNSTGPIQFGCHQNVAFVSRALSTQIVMISIAEM